MAPTPPAPGPRGLGGGLDDEVRAIVGDGDLVYVGGRFPRGIRLWNQASLQWSELGGGVDGWVNDIAIYEGEVYVTGAFSFVVNGDGSQVAARNVAVWSGTSWRALGDGVAANPHSLAIALDDAGNVYVGGAFNGPARNIARWLAGEERWSCLGYDCSLDAGRALLWQRCRPAGIT